ncbi:glucose-1-phosphate adenylyltransferase subunit GlgD [uncultured Clostridium sp.]|uniref:glucose-1-phosphate adenylyltransferase subunit GlgD n=1 Tax=uncultured Clostridium sp. TaxID=59620 RepID=UPI002639CD91|nr:glucose-1-phosphate adenylyltransferase subunit GlgD [uncultured Clostridium sp.]
MNDCIGIINLDEDEKGLGELVKKRNLGSVPIAGKYRMIDFVLSNMTNSGVECIGIFTKNKSRSLMDHLTNGRPWDLHRKKDGLKVFNFGEEDPQFSDVRNFLENIEFIKYSRKEYILIAPSYMVCNIEYRQLIQEHKKNNNDVTIVYKEVKNADKTFVECDVLNLDVNNKVLSIGKNLGEKKCSNISMEMYFMKTELFIDIVYDCIRSGEYRKVKEFIHSKLNTLNVFAYKFEGYLSCINTLEEYYKTNMNFLNPEISEELFSGEELIYTKAKDCAPTLYTEDSKVGNSIIANGCYIEGEVNNCVIGRSVHVAKGAKLEGCIIMQNSTIGKESELKNIIVEKNMNIEEKEKYIGTEEYPVVIQRRGFNY